MNVNQKGVKGLIKVIDNLQDEGYYCFTPFDDHSPIDLIAVNDLGQAYKIQVKCRSLSCPELKASSVVNGKRVDINRDMIDGWAVYIIDLDKIFYISKDFMMGRKSHKININTDYGKLSGWDPSSFAKRKEP